MFSFEEKIIDATVKKLLNGEDYRQEVVNDINVKFLDFTLEFFKKIVDAKINDKKINLDWYKKYFLSDKNFDKGDIAIYSGMNLKTIHNISGTTTSLINNLKFKINNSLSIINFKLSIMRGLVGDW